MLTQTLDGIGIMDARACCTESTLSRSIHKHERSGGTKDGIFRRLLDTFGFSRERQLELEIVRLIGGPDGRLTDKIERRIEKLLMRNENLSINRW
jgi:hypothetical protein